MILSARDLTFTYPGGITALDGLDLDVPGSGRMAVLGANGAGKTTLLLHLNGSLRPARGEIRLAGRPVGYDRRSLLAWRSKVGLVLQDPDDQLFAGSVREDVSFGPLNLGLGADEVDERVAAALAAMRIEALADRPVHMLSGGQKKRVAIAGVVAMRPEVLILDEPSSGLDPHGVAHLLAALDHLLEAGTSIVYTTHDVDLACAWADRVAVFAAGQVIREGAPEVVLADQALLRRTHLRRPLTLDVGLALRESGLIAGDAPLPRSRRALLDLLSELPGQPKQPSEADRRHRRGLNPASSGGAGRSQTRVDG